MLATRASTRNAQRLARSFATVVDSAGIKVAAVDANQPTSSVTFLVKAGSRFEPQAGVAHGLKNFAFKSTAKRSALGTIRESELYGGVLSASLSREYLALTADFLKGDEEYFVDVLSSFVTSGRFTRHEFEEYVLPVVESETHAGNSTPAVHALEHAHALAFRNGLGSSLFANEHPSFTAEDIKAFAKSAFTKGNIAVLGSGISQKLFRNSLTSPSANFPPLHPQPQPPPLTLVERLVSKHTVPRLFSLALELLASLLPNSQHLLLTYHPPPPSSGPAASHPLPLPFLKALQSRLYTFLTPTPPFSVS
ncbi:ubiquinol-cytochrome c reductase core subunit 1 [Marasmius tenuissimus]|nr:ubiquinol-cytochrome c reductase core subunit 1 [Marasmius tenuissimus]